MVAEFSGLGINIMESSNLVVFTSEDLRSLTDSFKQKNLIGVTQFGKLYKGWLEPSLTCKELGRHVTVKIWDEKSNCLNLVSDEYLMVKVSFQINGLNFLQSVFLFLLFLISS